MTAEVSAMRSASMLTRRYKLGDHILERVFHLTPLYSQHKQELNKFVTNALAVIHEFIKVNQWFCAESACDPADYYFCGLEILDKLPTWTK